MLAGLLCLLSNIPSHKECLEIDNNYYIGENFELEDFEDKKNIVSNRVKNIDKNKLKEFQSKYLSARAMTQEYEKKYKMR